MADITMCSGIGCDNKETCYRAMAIPSMRQSYFAEPPLKEKSETGAARCKYYWPVEPKEHIIEKIDDNE